MRLLLGVWALLAAAPLHASLLSGEMVDKAADVLTVLILIVVPIVGVVIFWLVHILPEKFAHKRHHPQRDAIQVLCLLSLVFGGLLWPIAWLWAFTKPVLHRAAYGTDKHDDYFTEKDEQHRAGGLGHEEALRLREELEAIEARGALPPRLRALKEELTRPRVADAQVRAAPPAKPEDKAA